MMQTKKMCTGKCLCDKVDFDHLGSGGGGVGSSHQETPRFRMQEKPLVSGEKYSTSRLHMYPTSPQILSGVGTAPSIYIRILLYLTVRIKVKNRSSGVPQGGSRRIFGPPP